MTEIIRRDTYYNFSDVYYTSTLQTYTRLRYRRTHVYVTDVHTSNSALIDTYIRLIRTKRIQVSRRVYFFTEINLQSQTKKTNKQAEQVR